MFLLQGKTLPAAREIINALDCIFIRINKNIDVLYHKYFNKMSQIRQMAYVPCAIFSLFHFHAIYANLNK